MLKNLKRRAVLKIIAPVVVVLTGISISWAIVVHKPQPKSELLNDEAPLAQVVQVEPQTVKLNIRSHGVVAARTEIDLVPEVAGQVVELHPSLVAGGFFNRGDVLIKIDPRSYDHAIAEAQARIAEAERQVMMEEAQAEQARNEWHSLGEGQPSALILREPQLAEARAKLKAAQADLANARLQRSRCRMARPVCGARQGKKYRARAICSTRRKAGPYLCHRRCPGAPRQPPTSLPILTCCWTKETVKRKPVPR